jgi:hypothetical protein
MIPVTIGSVHGLNPPRGWGVVAGLATQGGQFCTLNDPLVAPGLSSIRGV